MAFEIQKEKIFYRDDNFLFINGEAKNVLSKLPAESVDCVVTSPPYFGQRDYGSDLQIGLEDTPEEFVKNLVNIFDEVKRVLKPSGSLWVNIGDTYWSGKGQARGIDKKRGLKRFLRPQDKTGKKPLCVPKQLLLIPHRFAIAMQEKSWIVRNDNVWAKSNPIPDPARDRCSSSHEYVFHFVKERYYYFDHKSVAVPSSGKNRTKPPSTVWDVPQSSSNKLHSAPFSKELVQLPLRATCPSGGVFLDPFCGSGTSLLTAVEEIKGIYAIGIDVNENFLSEAVNIVGEIDLKKDTFYHLSEAVKIQRKLMMLHR